MIGSCIVQNISQLHHRENGISNLKKSFDEAGAYSNDTKVSFPGQKGWAWAQLLPDQILSNSERDSPQNFAKNHENV